jgi:capsid protein
MGKSKRQRNRPSQAHALAATPAAEIAPDMQYAGYSGFSAANYSLNRAQIFWPTLETRDELDTYSHQEILRKCRWLAANVGFIKGFIKNGADLVGYMTPQSICGDEKYEEILEEAFRNRTATAGVFDRAGKYNFRTAQTMLTRQALRDGDVLTILAESQAGGAMFGFYEAHQIRNPKSPGDQKWYNGILLNAEDRHIKYAIGMDKNEALPIDADRAIYFGEFDSVGNRRAYPPLAHAVNHALDITETWANVKSAIKHSSLIAAVRERDGSAPNTKSTGGLPGVLRQTGNPSAPGELDTATVWGAGQIPSLPPGEKMKILHDSRPSTQQMDFVAALKDECAYGFGIPPEVMLSIANLTGPGVRFVMERAARWIEMRQLVLEEWCRRVWVYTIAKEIKAKRIPAPPAGVQWWKVDFIPMRDITIDYGREGRMHMEEVDKGYETRSNYCRRKGKDWRDNDRQAIKEAKFRLAECQAAEVPYDLVFPRSSSLAPLVENSE